MAVRYGTFKNLRTTYLASWTVPYFSAIFEAYRTNVPYPYHYKKEYRTSVPYFLAKIEAYRTYVPFRTAILAFNYSQL